MLSLCDTSGVGSALSVQPDSFGVSQLLCGESMEMGGDGDWDGIVVKLIPKDG